MTKPKIIFAFIFISVIIISCDKKVGSRGQSAYPINCDTITFSKNVAPIISKSCAKTGCHVAGFPNGDYTTYAGLNTNVTSGKFKLRVFDSPANPMPQDAGMLPADKLAILKCWLDKGAPND